MLVNPVNLADTCTSVTSSLKEETKIISLLPK